MNDAKWQSMGLLRGILNYHSKYRINLPLKSFLLNLQKYIHLLKLSLEVGATLDPSTVH